jgi:hypothetical protein
MEGLVWKLPSFIDRNLPISSQRPVRSSTCSGKPMPMQPAPSADTSRLLFRNLHFSVCLLQFIDRSHRRPLTPWDSEARRCELLLYAKRPTRCCRFAGYLAPCISIPETAFSMLHRSSAVKSTGTAPRFSSRRCNFVVPGIGPCSRWVLYPSHPDAESAKLGQRKNFL